MRILFCGTAVPDEIEYQVRDISAAGNRFQNNMIRNLRAMGHEVHVLSYQALPLSRQARETLGAQRLENRKSESLQSENTQSENRFDGCTYVFREQAGVTGTLAAVKACETVAKRLLGNSDCVISYNVFYNFLRIPSFAKKAGKRSVLVLADYSAPESFRGRLRRLYARFQMRTMRKYDIIVGLSRGVQTYLKENQIFHLMEGGIDADLFERFSYASYQRSRPIRLMYAGLLSPVTGIDLLFGVFEKHILPAEVELSVSGKGELEELAKRVAEREKQVQYLGHLSYDAYLSRLQKADVLINPRNMALPENANNFPSKVMDYLATGKPIISSKFAGWERFAEQILFYDDLESELPELVERIAAQSEQEQRARFEARRACAADFLWQRQLGRILRDE